MNKNQIYTTKDIRNIVTEMIKKFNPEAAEARKGTQLFDMYRDNRKKGVRYKVVVRPSERFLKYLQEALPKAEVKAFNWKCWHPLAPQGWITPTISILVPYTEAE